MKKIALFLVPFCLHAEIYNKPQDNSAVTISLIFTPVYNNNPNMAPHYNIENKPQFITYISSLSYSVGMNPTSSSIIIHQQKKLRIALSY